MLEKGLLQSSVGAQFGGLRPGIDLHPLAHLTGDVLRELESLSLSYSPFLQRSPTSFLELSPASSFILHDIYDPSHFHQP